MLSFMRLRISSTDKTRFGYKKESITSRQPLRLRYLKVYTGAEDNQKKLPVMKKVRDKCILQDDPSFHLSMTCRHLQL